VANLKKRAFHKLRDSNEMLVSRLCYDHGDFFRKLYNSRCIRKRRIDEVVELTNQVFPNHIIETGTTMVERDCPDLKIELPVRHTNDNRLSNKLPQLKEDEWFYIDVKRVPGVMAYSLPKTPELAQRVYDFCIDNINKWAPIYHGDWNLDNIIVDGDKMTLIDFDYINTNTRQENIEKLDRKMKEIDQLGKLYENVQRSCN